MAYADSTALIALARLGKLELLSAVSDDIRVTMAVWEEITADQTKAGIEELLRARRSGLLTVVREGDPQAFSDLGRGESSVLSAASPIGANVILDERRARSMHESRPELRDAIPQCVGVVGILLRAKTLGMLAAVKPLLDQLLLDGFRISSTLRSAVLDAAGE